MLETLVAEGFRNVAAAGRTQPLILSCRPAARPEEEPREFVVKAMGLPEMFVERLFYEVFGNLLAREFGVPTPEPALVEITEEFHPLLERSLHAARQGSVPVPGTAVGAEYLGPGLSSPTTLAPLKDSELVDAASIYAFDHAVQNPDRRVNNPNCMADGAHFIAIDFEMCFSFLLWIFPLGAPWEVSRHKLYAGHEHLFRRSLAAASVDWGPVEAAVAGLTEERLKMLTLSIPAEWKGHEGRVFGHLLELAAHAAEFIDELRRSLP